MYGYLIFFFAGQQSLLSIRTVAHPLAIVVFVIFQRFEFVVLLNSSSNPACSATSGVLLKSKLSCK